LDESSLVLILGLILLGAIITLAHAALLNSRPAQLKERAEMGNYACKIALELQDARSKLAVTYALCMALIQFLIAVVFTYSVLIPLLINQQGALAIVVAIVGAIAVLILTQVAPEGVGSAYAPVLMPVLVYPLRWVVVLLSPVTQLLVAFSKLIAGLFGGSELVNIVTNEEIMTLVNAGEFEEDEKDMIYSVLQLDQRDARQLMVPRMDVVAIDVKEPIDKALEQFINSGFSRIPVYEDNIDNIVGLLYAKDLLMLWRNGKAHSVPMSAIVRGAYFVPETLRADDLLKSMQKRNVHMAIVVDEYGGTSGVITIENLIEEIIGDIRDEYDTNEEVEYTKISDTEYTVDASMNIADINELMELDIPEDGEYDTIGGYIYSQLGRVPHLGDDIEKDTFTLAVRSIEGRRIRKVQIVKVIKAPEPETKEGKSETKETPTITDTQPNTPSPDQPSNTAAEDGG
jgi:putative hemolysin